MGIAVLCAEWNLDTLAVSTFGFYTINEPSIITAIIVNIFQVAEGLRLSARPRTTSPPRSHGSILLQKPLCTGVSPVHHHVFMQGALRYRL